MATTARSKDYFQEAISETSSCNKLLSTYLSFGICGPFLFHLWLQIHEYHNSKLLNTARRTTKLIWNEQHVQTGNGRRSRMRIRFAAVLEATNMTWTVPGRSRPPSTFFCHATFNVAMRDRGMTRPGLNEYFLQFFLVDCFKCLSGVSFLINSCQSEK